MSQALVATRKVATGFDQFENYTCIEHHYVRARPLILTGAPLSLSLGLSLSLTLFFSGNFYTRHDSPLSFPAWSDINFICTVWTHVCFQQVSEAVRRYWLFIYLGFFYKRVKSFLWVRFIINYQPIRGLIRKPTKRDSFALKNLLNFSSSKPGSFFLASSNILVLLWVDIKIRNLPKPLLR